MNKSITGNSIRILSFLRSLTISFCCLRHSLQIWRKKNTKSLPSQAVWSFFSPVHISSYFTAVVPTSRGVSLGEQPWNNSKWWENPHTAWRQVRTSWKTSVADIVEAWLRTFGVLNSYMALLELKCRNNKYRSLMHLDGFGWTVLPSLFPAFGST